MSAKTQTNRRSAEQQRPNSPLSMHHAAVHMPIRHLVWHVLRRLHLRSSNKTIWCHFQASLFPRDTLNIELSDSHSAAQDDDWLTSVIRCPINLKIHTRLSCAKSFSGHLVLSRTPEFSRNKFDKSKSWTTEWCHAYAYHRCWPNHDGRFKFMEFATIQGGLKWLVIYVVQILNDLRDNVIFPLCSRRNLNSIAVLQSFICIRFNVRYE